MTEIAMMERGNQIELVCNCMPEAAGNLIAAETAQIAESLLG